MLKLQYTAAAETDLNDLSESGFAAHGKVAMIRYNRLIRVTVESLCENPEAIGSKEVMKGIKMFHLRHLREKISYEGTTVKSPSHYICFRVIDNEILEVVRILREEMDFHVTFPSIVPC